MKRFLGFAAVFVLGAVVGAVAVMPSTARRNFAKGLQQGRHDVQLEAIKADAATMKGGRFVWTPAR